MQSGATALSLPIEIHRTSKSTQLICWRYRRESVKANKRQKTGGGPMRKRTEMLAINVNILGVVLQRFPNGVGWDEILAQVEGDVSERTLSRYLKDWIDSGFMMRTKQKGEYTLSKLGELTFLKVPNV